MSGAWWVWLAILSGSPEAHTVHFDTEIIPVLTKAGCNAGACHGAAAGRGGFHLSLLGGNPAADYESIVHQYEGRRVNRAHPELSLVFAKPTGRLEHGGEVVLEEGGPSAERLLAWLRAGAPRGKPRTLTNFAVTPADQMTVRQSEAIRLKAIARFDHGPEVDVTAWTVLQAADPESVIVSDHSQVRISRPGQHTVTARFLNRVLPLQFNVPFSSAPIELASQPRANFIDEHVVRVLGELGLPPSPPAREELWLRRVTLDLTGRLPSPADIAAFLADESTDKRDRVVDSLLASEAFTDYWALRFARLLRLHSLPNESEVADVYGQWLRREIAAGTPLDQLGRELLTAVGDSHVNGPANFARMVPDARAHAELVGQFFLGVQLGCANCHNHPLDKWTQDDYHGLAAVFARLDRSRIVQVTSSGGVTNLRTNEPAIPRIPGVRDLVDSSDPRNDFANWVFEDDNSYFARATVNRLWSAMFGRGLVEPTNDLRETNPPTHPELLDELARDFMTHDYDIRHTLKSIALSHTYGRSSQTLPGNQVDDRFYAHAYRRPLGPEVLADAIADVTGVPNTFADQPQGTRAVRLLDPSAPAPALDVLGRCSHLEACEVESTAAAGLQTQLHLMNGDLINSKLADDSGRLRQLVATGHQTSDIVHEFFIRALCRAPTEDQLHHWCEQLEAQDPRERTRRLEDFVWSLLNSRDFCENH